MRMMEVILTAIAVGTLIVASVSGYVTYQMLARVEKVETGIDLLAGGKTELMIKAAKEGSLMFYSSAGLSHTAFLVDAFREKYPFIDVEFYRASSYPLMEKYDSEARAGKYYADVILIGPCPATEMKDKGYFAEYVSPEFENIPDEIKDPDNMWVTHNIIITGLVVNTDLVPEDLWPEDWLDFINPKQEWFGKTAAADPRILSFGYNALWSIDHYLGRDNASDVFTGLAQTEPALFTGSTAGCEMAVTGEAPYVFIMTQYKALWYKFAKNNPIGFIIPESGIPAYTHSLAVLENATHPNAARLFFDFLISEEAQSDMALNLYRYPANIKATPPTGLPPLDQMKLLLLDIAQSVEDRDALLPLWESWMGVA